VTAIDRRRAITREFVSNRTTPTAADDSHIDSSSPSSEIEHHIRHVIGNDMATVNGSQTSPDCSV
jgi:hypothetical protein